MERDDFRGASLDIPRDLQDACLRFGGKNPYDEPFYRLVIAESRVMKVGGNFVDWDENIPVEEREGILRMSVDCAPEPMYAKVGKRRRRVGTRTSKEVMLPSEAKPLRTVMEIREVQKYPNHTGIILERWFPPSCFGTRTEWESHTTPNGLPLLGPYPETGSYELVSDASNVMPSISKLRDVISFWERNHQNRGETPEARRRKRINDAERKVEQREAKLRQEIVEKLSEGKGILLGTSLAAGRMRQELARKAGLKGHFGN